MLEIQIWICWKTIQYDNNFDLLMCFQTFVRSDLAWAFGYTVSHTSLLTRRARESHQTFALDFSRLLSQMKLGTTSCNWWHILGSGFQHVAIYHKEASITWLATKSLQLDCAMSFDLRENISLSRLASMAKYFATETFILSLIPAFGWSAAQITTNFL